MAVSLRLSERLTTLSSPRSMRSEPSVAFAVSSVARIDRCGNRRRGF